MTDSISCSQLHEWSRPCCHSDAPPVEFLSWAFVSRALCWMTHFLWTIVFWNLFERCSSNALMNATGCTSLWGEGHGCFYGFVSTKHWLVRRAGCFNSFCFSCVGFLVYFSDLILKFLLQHLLSLLFTSFLWNHTCKRVQCQQNTISLLSSASEPEKIMILLTSHIPPSLLPFYPLMGTHKKSNI